MITVFIIFNSNMKRQSLLSDLWKTQENQKGTKRKCKTSTNADNADNQKKDRLLQLLQTLLRENRCDLQEGERPHRGAPC